MSLAFWALLAFATQRLLSHYVFLSGGTVRIRVRIMQRLLMDRFNVYLATKPMLTEERNYDERNTTVLYSWEEGVHARGAWGGGALRAAAKQDKQSAQGRARSGPPQTSSSPAPLRTRPRQSR